MTFSRRRFISAGLATSILAIGNRSATSLGGMMQARPSEPPLFFDNDGLIVHRNIDGGDTAQREGWYWFGVWLRANFLRPPDPWLIQRKLSFRQVIDLLEPGKNGIFFRHPKLPPWNNPFDKKFGFSRDQMVPLVAAMGVWGFETELRRLWNALPQDPLGGTKHAFNGEFLKLPLTDIKTVHTGDPVGPATINHFRRAWNENPILASDGNGPAGEKELLANVGLRLVSAAADRDDTGDDLNLIVMLLLALIRFPSECKSGSPEEPCTANAVNQYAKNRPVSYGSFLGTYRDKFGEMNGTSLEEVRKRLDAGIANGWLTDESRVFGAVKWYHRESTGANPALAEMYRPIIKRFLE